MKTLIIGFSRPRKFKIFSEIIRMIDGSDFSHAYLRFKSATWGCDFIYQSSGTHTNFMGGSAYEMKNIVVEEYALTISSEIESQIGKLCVDREGKPYPVLQIIGKGLVKLSECLGFKISNPFSNGDEKTDCIEEVAVILSKGLDIKTPLDMDAVRVLEFRNWISKIPSISLLGAK